MTTGIDLILLDHRKVEACFEDFGRTRDTTLVGRIIDMLTAHDEAEQHALYPLMDAVGVPARDVAEARRAHSLVQALMDHTRQQEGAALLADVSALQQAVQRHVRQEEQSLLPALQQRATPDQLDGLAARILQVKQRVG